MILQNELCIIVNFLNGICYERGKFNKISLTSLSPFDLKNSDFVIDFAVFRISEVSTKYEQRHALGFARHEAKRKNLESEDVLIGETAYSHCISG